MRIAIQIGFQVISAIRHLKAANFINPLLRFGQMSALWIVAPILFITVDRISVVGMAKSLLFTVLPVVFRSGINQNAYAERAVER